MSIVHFVIGNPNKVLYTCGLMMVVNLVIALIEHKHPVKRDLHHFFERVIAYLAFIVIANRLDDLMINDLFAWSGSTQLMVALYLCAREMKMVTAYLYHRFGIEIPLLSGRLGEVKQSSLQFGSTVHTRHYERMAELANEFASVEHGLTDSATPIC